MRVWIVMEQTAVRVGQEASDCDYSSRVFEVFLDQHLAKITVDFLNARCSDGKSGYFLTDHEVSEKLNPAIAEFAKKQEAKAGLLAEIAHHQKKIESLQQQLKSY